MISCNSKKVPECCFNHIIDITSHNANLEVAGEHARLVAAVDSDDGTRHVTTIASLQEEQSEKGGKELVRDRR